MAKNQDLPGVDGPGVAPLKIPEIEKAINKYQRKKDERCQASPGEVAAKQELRALLHEHKSELPVNAQGIPFYRYDERDYLLEEKLKVQKIVTDEEDD